MRITDGARRDLRLNLLIQDVARLQRKLLDVMTQPSGIGRAQWLVISLSRHGGMTQSELAEQLDTTRANLGMLVDKLEAGGIVYRVRDKRDGRLKRVYLTDQGQSMVTEYQKLEPSYADVALKGISNEERDMLVVLLTRIKSSLQEGA